MSVGAMKDTHNFSEYLWIAFSLEDGYNAFVHVS